MPLLHAREPALLGGLEPLALDGVDVDHHRALGVESLRQGLSQGGDVVPVDHPDVGQVELLEEEPRGCVRLDRGLHLGAQLLDAPAKAERQLREALLGGGAGLVEPAVQTDALEVARDRPDVGRDRHPVVVEDDHHRRLQPAGVMQRLIGDPAGESAVADHGDDLAVLADPFQHPLLQADAVADRG